MTDWLWRDNRLDITDRSFLPYNANQKKRKPANAFYDKERKKKMSFREEVIQLLIDTAVRILGADASALSADTNFAKDLGAKSTDIVKFTVALEDEYDVEVPFMAFKRCETFQAAADYISELTGIE